jgi:amidophosphoribosyltransferase
LFVYGDRDARDAQQSEEGSLTVQELREECGLFGIHGAHEAAELVYLGLYALQHRGQESAGLAVSDDTVIRGFKNLGLVCDVLTSDVIESLPGHIGCGHVRYSTTGSTVLENAQPILVDYKKGQIAVAHNGNLVNSSALRRRMEAEGSIFQTSSDSETIIHLLARSKQETIEDMLVEALSFVQGAYSLIVITKDGLIGARDPLGFRPLCLGRLSDAYIICSESCALDIVGADFIREIEPGEVVSVSERGVETKRLSHSSPERRQCIFEHIYFSRPDSVVFGESVDGVRRRLGIRLAEEHPVDADIVISVPDSSNSAALGYSEASGIPFELGLIRNHYIGRTFINPVPRIRDQGVRVKFNPVREILEGKRVVVVDDSIVRGTTSRKLIKLIRKAGATEVHFRISSPPICYPCFYGIDTPRRSELIASSYTVDEITTYLRVDSLGYLSLAGLRSCVSQPNEFCYACFDGSYCIPFDGEPDKLALERHNSH